MFEEELWIHFGPTDGDDFDEALSKIQQTGSLQEYQREFERLQNKVEGWTQKALIGTYMGCLNPAIADSVRMFRPKMLKDVLNLARLRDEQMQRQRKSLVTTHRTKMNPWLQQIDSTIQRKKNPHHREKPLVGYQES